MANICLLAFVEGDAPILQLLSVFQSIVVFAFALAVLITAPTFGSNPECNHHAWLVLLRPIKVFNAGRIVGGVGCGIVIFLYIGMVVLGKYKQAKTPKNPPDEIPSNTATSQPDKDMPIRKPSLDPDVEKTVLDALVEHRDKACTMQHSLCQLEKG